MQERDELAKKLAEAQATAASAPAAAPAPSAAVGEDQKQQWEAERTELIASRDSAAKNAQVRRHFYVCHLSNKLTGFFRPTRSNSTN